MVAMDGKSSLLQTHLLLPLPCCCSQITQKPVHPAPAVAAPCLEALVQHWLLQPQSLQVCLPRPPLGIWDLLHFMDSAGVPCPRRRPASYAEGTKGWNSENQSGTLAPHRVAFDGGIGAPHQQGWCF